MSRLNLLEETRYEKLPVNIYADKLPAGRAANPMPTIASGPNGQNLRRNALYFFRHTPMMM